MPSAAFQDAWVKYCTLFPTLASLGSGDPPAAWKAELDAVSPGAFDQVVATSLALEGGNMAGQLNFPQMHLVRALYARRAALDEDFANPYDTAAPAPPVRRQLGSLVRLSGC